MLDKKSKKVRQDKDLQLVSTLAKPSFDKMSNWSQRLVAYPRRIEKSSALLVASQYEFIVCGCASTSQLKNTEFEMS